MRNTELFDDYLSGKLNSEDKTSFEKRLSEDSELMMQFSEHKNFVEVLKQQHQKQELKAKLKSIHTEAFGKANVFSIDQNKTGMLRYLRPVGFAASIAIITIIGTIGVLSIGGYLIKNQNDSITLLEHRMKVLENTDQVILKSFSNKKKKKYFLPANVEGTGFAINNKGYLITSLHMVKGSDSVFVENAEMERVSARIVHTDNRLDLAILKLDSAAFLKGRDIPFVFKSGSSDLGEKIFTLGYPGDDIVYGEGSISSASGSGDTAMYQISIPVNPGNSGGPLLDEQGYIIGLVRGKNTSAEGTGFAVKAQYIYQLINSIDDKELKAELSLNKRNNIKSLKRSEQIKRLQPFVFNIQVYKGN
ncbi:MAG: S1C family serine protease [Bacteroidia bacterium]